MEPGAGVCKRISDSSRDDEDQGGEEVKGRGVGIPVQIGNPCVGSISFVPFRKSVMGLVG